MSEVSDDFRSMREESMSRRASNRENSSAILDESKVAYEAKNGGAHLIVKYGSKTVDFWPGTGLWIDRKTQKKSRGVFNLLRFLEVK